MNHRAMDVFSKLRAADRDRPRHSSVPITSIGNGRARIRQRNRATPTQHTTHRRREREERRRKTRATRSDERRSLQNFKTQHTNTTLARLGYLITTKEEAGPGKRKTNTHEVSVADFVALEVQIERGEYHTYIIQYPKNA